VERTVKLGCAFTQTAWADGTHVRGRVETAEEFGKRI